MLLCNGVTELCGDNVSVVPDSTNNEMTCSDLKSWFTVLPLYMCVYIDLYSLMYSDQTILFIWD